MKINIANCQRDRPDHSTTVTDPADKFEILHEQRVRVQRRDRPLRVALEGATVRCRDVEHSGRLCPLCERFLSVVPSPDGSELTVRCLFLETDSVDLLMTGQARLVAIEHLATVGEARGLARGRHICQLLVTENDEVVGLLPLASIAEANPDDEVRGHMRVPVPVIGRNTSLAAAARLMREYGVRCLLVAERDTLVGLITSGDLRRAGVPDQILSG